MNIKIKCTYYLEVYGVGLKVWRGKVPYENNMQNEAQNHADDHLIIALKFPHVLCFSEFSRVSPNCIKPTKYSCATELAIRRRKIFLFIYIN